MLSLVDVYKYIDEFEASKKYISLVAAGTGTGKSTTFPEGFYRRDKEIFLVQPTIKATLGTAAFMGRDRIPSHDIGTAADSEINYKNKKLYLQDDTTTPIVYCTAGHFRNILMKYVDTKKPQKFTDYIFLDEAHHGDLNYDGILYFYNYLVNLVEAEDLLALKEEREPTIALPKLLLITATPGKSPFTDDRMFIQVYEGAKAKEIKMRYHKKDYIQINGKDYQDIFTDVTEVVVKTHNDTPVPVDEWDAWLVFCPGKKEIQGVVDALKKKTHNTVIIPLFSGNDDPNVLDYNMVPAPGIRKIVVATNVAEASITIDALTYVFDTLVEKVQVKSRTGGNMLSKVNISKSSAQQRRGRTGRTKPGTCYRMCTEKYFKTFNEKRPREIERISPDNFVLDLLSRRLEIEEIVTDNAIPPSTLLEIKKRLATIGLLTDDGESITTAGFWAKSSALSPRSAMFFWLWAIYSEYNPFIGAVLTSVLETHTSGYLFIDKEFGPTADTIIKKKFLPVLNDLKAAQTKSSYFFQVSLIMYIISTFRSIEIPSTQLRLYCKDNHLDTANISACLKLIQKLAVKRSNITNGPVKIGNFDVEQEISKAEPYIYQCYSDLSYSIGSKRHKIKSDIDSFLGPRDQISNRSIVIPLSVFETDYKTNVSMYHTIDKKPPFKISFKKEYNIPVDLTLKKEEIA